MFPSSIDDASPSAQAVYRTTLIVALVLWLLPLFGVALTSIRSLEDLNQGNYWGWPNEIRLVDNYLAVLADPRMAQFIFNSFAITIPAVAGAVALSCLAGFALAKYRFPGNRILFAVFIAGNLVPFQSLMIPVRDLMVALGLYDTRWAIVVFHAAFQTGFCTLFMRNFIRELPDALLETARLEGMSEFMILVQIVLPLVRPAIAAVSVLIFTFVWNDFFWALVLVHSDDVRPVTAGLQSLRGMWIASWHLISAGSIVAALPPVVIFFLMQRHFIAGLTLGATAE
jgi:multiple sugar transport system permease protein